MQVLVPFLLGSRNRQRGSEVHARRPKEYLTFLSFVALSPQVGVTASPLLEVAGPFPQRIREPVYDADDEEASAYPNGFADVINAYLLGARAA